jgi:hypothetical protein
MKITIVLAEHKAQNQTSPSFFRQVNIEYNDTKPLTWLEYLELCKMLDNLKETLRVNDPNQYAKLQSAEEFMKHATAELNKGLKK